MAFLTLLFYVSENKQNFQLRILDRFVTFNSLFVVYFMFYIAVFLQKVTGCLYGDFSSLTMSLAEPVRIAENLSLHSCEAVQK